MARAIELYKTDLREIVGQGNLYRLESPYDHPRACLDYVSPDRSKAVLFIYQLRAGGLTPVKVEGLDQERNYAVKEVNLPEGAPSQLPADGQTIPGATLARVGLVSPCKIQYDSAIIEFEAR
jgi:alpha-galactosidase